MLQRLLLLGLMAALVSAAREQGEPEDRIVGGLNVSDTMAPFMVYLEGYDEDNRLINTCGGIIMNTTLILTTASCLYKTTYLECFAGTANRDLHADSSVTQKVRGVGVWHADYGKNSVENDIGVVRLQKALELGPTVALAPVPKKSQLGKDKHAGKKVTIYGWGFEARNSTENAEILNRANMTVIKNDDCKKQMKEAYYLLASTSFCVETMGDALGFCEGDVGGAVIYHDTTSKPPSSYVVGIMSDHFHCHSYYPNVLTSLVTFGDWIAQQGGPKIK